MKYPVLMASVALLLAACGGGSGESGSAGGAAHVQQQQQKIQPVPHLTATDIKANQAKLAQQAKTMGRHVRQQATDYEGVVQSLYIAYFGRPADPNGLAAFEANLQADGAPTTVQGLLDVYDSDPTVQNLVDSFGNSPESLRLYGTGDPSTFVTTVFTNLLNRQPLAQGLDYWSTQIALGNVTQGEAALTIMVGALGNTTAQGMLDAQLIDNRIAAATYFTGELYSLNDTYAYSGANAAATVRSALATVDASTDAGSYQNALNGAINTLVADMPPSGSASDYAQADGFFTWTGSENGTIVLDYLNNQFSVDADTGTVVDLASNQQLNGLSVDANAELVYNGTVIGDLILVTASDGGQVAQFSYTLNGQNGTAQINVGSGSYTVTCGNCGN